MAPPPSASNRGLLQGHPRPELKGAVGPQVYLSRRETRQLATALLGLVGSKRVPTRAALYELTGIPQETYSRYASQSSTGRRMPVERAKLACKAVNIPYPYHQRTRRQGCILISEGDQEEYLDALLLDWASHHHPGSVCPTAQIAVIIFNRWEARGFEPLLVLRSPARSRHSASIRTKNFEPGIEYEVLLDLVTAEGRANLVRHSLDESSGRWLPCAAGSWTMSGASLVDIDWRLKLCQRQLQRNRGGSAESRLQQMKSFEESVTKKFSKLHQAP